MSRPDDEEGRARVPFVAWPASIAGNGALRSPIKEILGKSASAHPVLAVGAQVCVSVADTGISIRPGATGGS